MYSIILSYLIFASGTAGLTDYLSLYRIITVVNMLLQPHPGPTVNLYNKINLFNSIGVSVSSFLYKYPFTVTAARSKVGKPVCAVYSLVKMFALYS